MHDALTDAWGGASELCGTAVPEDASDGGFVETTVRDGKRLLH
jgi:hypothetical protein